MKKKQSKKVVLSVSHYTKSGKKTSLERSDYSVRCVRVSPVGYYYSTVERFEVSKSKKRTSWYDDFYSSQDAHKFARSLFR